MCIFVGNSTKRSVILGKLDLKLSTKYFLVFQELIELDKQASAEKAAFLQETMLDWETRRSDALLDLRRKHLQELAKHAQVNNGSN